MAISRLESCRSSQEAMSANQFRIGAEPGSPMPASRLIANRPPSIPRPVAARSRHGKGRDGPSAKP
jgi:hypothetical protein